MASSVRALGLVFSLGLVACSGGGSSSSDNNLITSAVQDLTLDPTGLTTVITFTSDPGVLTLAQFDASGGQNATSVSQAGLEATVEWDARVTPSYDIRVLNAAHVPEDFVDVTTSDSSAPTFVITSATQVVGLGADTISVQFSGPRVIKSEAESLANWTLKVGTFTMDLTGSTFTLDDNTQVLSVTTGPACNLHASFTLAATTLHSVSDVVMATTAVVGAATGDSVAPTIVSAAQNLSEDEWGRVIDFTFSEAMDPVFCSNLSNYNAASPDVSTTFEQPSAAVLRVSFNNPMVPGLNQVTLSGLMDAHGNLFAAPPFTAITAGSTVANNFVMAQVITVAGQGGDHFDTEFVQALDPDSASLKAKWTLEIPTGSVVDLTGATLTYNLLAKTLSIELVDDYANGTSFRFSPMVGNAALDVDGEPFNAAVVGVISGGDATAPTITSATQNRAADPTGATVDVLFSEDVEVTTAETEGNYAIAGFTVNSATRLSGLDIVRLVMDASPVPGDDTLNVANVQDLAGNTMTAVFGHALVSTDTTAPAPTAAVAQAVAGAANDTLVVTFNDLMIPSEVTNSANWTLQSPTGTPMSLIGAGIVWNAAAKVATLTLPAGSNFQGGDSFSVHCANMRDIAGNTVTTASVAGTVLAEVNVPEVDAVWNETAFPNRVHVRFTEPCDKMDDIAGLTHYTVRDNVGAIKGVPTVAIEDADALGVRLTYAFAVLTGSDTLDVSGVVDLAGNSMFPALLQPIDAEDPTDLHLDLANCEVFAVSGEDNDRVTIVFDRAPSQWTLLDPSNYTVTNHPFDMANARFSYDGDRTVTIDLVSLNAPSVNEGEFYDFFIHGLSSEQGVASTVIDSILSTGDTTPPILPAGKTRVDAANPTDSVLVEFDEAVDAASSQSTGNYTLNGGPNPDLVTQLGPRTVRATWFSGTIIGDVVDAGVTDLAGNWSPTSRAVTTQDVAGPLMMSVSALSVENAGFDTVDVVFNKPVDLATALDPTKYTLTNNGLPLTLSNASLRYTSATHTVTMHLAPGVELDPTAGVHVNVNSIKDHAGLVMSPPGSLGGLVSGDLTAPTLTAAFANYREAAGGTMIDVRFSEDVSTTFAGNSANWSVPGGPTVTAVQSISRRHYRLTLSAAMALGQSVRITGCPDMAGNAAGLLTISPTL